VAVAGGTDACWAAKRMFDELNADDALAVGSGDEKKSVKCFVQSPPWKEAVRKKGREFIAVLCNNGIGRESLEADYGARKFEVYYKPGEGRPLLLGD